MKSTLAQYSKVRNFRNLLEYFENATEDDFRILYTCYLFIFVIISCNFSFYYKQIFYSSLSNRLSSNFLSDWPLFLKLLWVFTLKKSLTLDVTGSKIWIFTFVFGISSLILPPLEKYWEDTIYILICFYICLCIKISSEQRATHGSYHCTSWVWR